MIQKLKMLLYTFLIILTKLVYELWRLLCLTVFCIPLLFIKFDLFKDLILKMQESIDLDVFTSEPITPKDHIGERCGNCLSGVPIIGGMTPKVDEYKLYCFVRNEHVDRIGWCKRWQCDNPNVHERSRG